MYFLKLYKILLQHQRLADKRNPMFEHNRFAKFLIYGMVVFWAAYMIFIGVMLPFVFMEIFPNMEPYHILHQGAICLLALDFLFRFSFQKPPLQEVKPYQLLPVSRNKVLSCYLIRSGISSYNLFWLFLLVPFSFLSLFRFWGWMGVVGFLFGWLLMIVLNNYWYLLCRTLIGENIVYVFLPVSFYLLWGVVEFLPEGHVLSQFSMNYYEGFFMWCPVTFLITFIAILFMVWLVQCVQGHFIYKELGKTENQSLRNVTEYKFLGRFGDIGEYLRLEIKLTFRNKMVRAQFILGIVMMIVFSLLLSLTEIYDNAFMTDFIGIYSFVVLGVMTLTRIMSVEGNYLDGLMIWKESILSLLQAKYIFNCMLLVIPFVMMIPTFVTDKVSLLMAVAYASMTAGPVYCMLFQLAVYNKKTLPLDTKLAGKNSGGSFLQTLLSSCAIFLPVAFDALMGGLLGEKNGLCVQLLLGLFYVLASPWWLRKIYQRFMKHRYENMEGFRDSR